jgi:2-O-methyltransferase
MPYQPARNPARWRKAWQKLNLGMRSLAGRLRGLPPIEPGPIPGDLVRRLVGREDPTLLEIGCNDGDHSLWLAGLFPSARIHCFEPDPRAAARFRRKTAGHPRLQLHEIAIGAHDGEADFHQSDGLINGYEELMPDGWDYSGSLRPPKEHLKVHARIQFGRTLKVRASTLDTWCAAHGIGPVDFLWMDVQGAEADVLDGARRTLGSIRYLYTEYDERELYEGQVGLRGLAERLPGFRLIRRYPNDALFRNLSPVQL